MNQTHPDCVRRVVWFLSSAVLVWAERCWMGARSPPSALNGRWHPWAELRLDQHLPAAILLQLGACPAQAVMDRAGGLAPKSHFGLCRDPG